MKFRNAVFSFSGAVAVCAVVLSGNTAQAIQINRLEVVAANDIQPAAQAAAAGKDMPMGQSAEGQPSLLPENAGVVNEGNVFGMQGGYFHPYLTIKEEYTDNLFNLDTNKTSNFLTTVSPGMWFALPRKKVIPITITPHNSSPGGLQQQLQGYEGNDRYVAYALGGLDFKYYSENSDLNTTDGTLEGLFRYNMRGGLSLQALDRFSRSEDRYDIGTLPTVSTDIGKYKSNFGMATADWLVTDRIRLKFDYSNFWLSYDDNFDAFKNRTDNGFDFYGYYVYSVKTSFFVEDKYVDVSYDTYTINDNTQNFVYGGIKWDTTEKLSILAKAGNQNRSFKNDQPAASGRKDYNGLAVDLQTLYKFTEKTKFTFDLYRTNEETDSTDASGKTVFGATAGYEQKYTDKLSGRVFLVYEDDNYDQLISQKRDDKVFSFQPAMQYLFRDWLMAELSYVFEKRDSSDNLFDYQTNTVYASLNFAL